MRAEGYRHGQTEVVWPLVSPGLCGLEVHALVWGAGGDESVRSTLASELGLQIRFWTEGLFSYVTLSVRSKFNSIIMWGF